MPRTQRKLTGGEAAGEIADTLLLTYAERSRQQGFVFGGKGTCVEFDFSSPPQLRTDDRLMLEDGRTVEVVAEVEPVLEVREKDFARAVRLAWRLGNQHVPVQILGPRIRVQHLPEVEAILQETGVAAVPLSAPFEPDDIGHGPEHGRDHHAHDHHHHEHHAHDHHAHDHHAHDHHAHDHHAREHPTDHRQSDDGGKGPFESAKTV